MRTFPADLAALHWHADPKSKRFRSIAAARRACAWLNNNDGQHDHWLFRPGPVQGDGSCALERRYVGGDVTWWAALQPAESNRSET